MVQTVSLSRLLIKISSPKSTTTSWTSWHCSQPLNAGVQIIFHLHYSPPIETVSPLCLKDSVGDYPEISSKDRVNDTHCFPISYRAGLLITGSCQVAQAVFACGKSLLIAPSHSSPSYALEKESRRICSITFSGTDVSSLSATFTAEIFYKKK